MKIIIIKPDFQILLILLRKERKETVGSILRRNSSV